MTRPRTRLPLARVLSFLILPWHTEPWKTQGLAKNTFQISLGCHPGPQCGIYPNPYSNGAQQIRGSWIPTSGQICLQSPKRRFGAKKKHSIKEIDMEQFVTRSKLQHQSTKNTKPKELVHYEVHCTARVCSIGTTSLHSTVMLAHVFMWEVTGVTGSRSWALLRVQIAYPATQNWTGQGIIGK